MTQQNELNAPWSLDFDRDGTEDIAIICDSNGDDLVRSRHFWLPEGDDPVPSTLAAMQVMASAPRLLKALNDLADQSDQDCPAEFRSRHFSEALEQANTVIAEASGRAA